MNQSRALVFERAVARLESLKEGLGSQFHTPEVARAMKRLDVDRQNREKGAKHRRSKAERNEDLRVFAESWEALGDKLRATLKDNDLVNHAEFGLIIGRSESTWRRLTNPKNEKNKWYRPTPDHDVADNEIQKYVWRGKTVTKKVPRWKMKVVRGWCDLLMKDRDEWADAADRKRLDQRAEREELESWWGSLDLAQKRTAMAVYQRKAARRDASASIAHFNRALDPIPARPVSVLKKRDGRIQCFIGFTSYSSDELVEAVGEGARVDSITVFQALTSHSWSDFHERQAWTLAVRKRLLQRLDECQTELAKVGDRADAGAIARLERNRETLKWADRALGKADAAALKDQLGDEVPGARTTRPPNPL